MKRLFESARYMAVAAAVLILCAAVGACVWASMKTIKVLQLVFTASSEGVAVGFVQVMDGFLIAAALLIFAFGMYELFVGALQLPDGLAIADLDALKSKLAGVVVLVLAGSFLERLEGDMKPLELLYTALAVAAVGGMLTLFARRH